jgi:hypothetical protein
VYAATSWVAVNVCMAPRAVHAAAASRSKVVEVNVASHADCVVRFTQADWLC